RTRRRLLLEAAAGALVRALVAGGVAGGRVLGWWSPSEESTAAPTSTSTPTGTPVESPFAGTPAEDFAEGADGIVLPAAEPVGEFSAQEVAEALEQVRRALIAARLDETMLIDHDPDEFLSLLAPDQQEAIGDAIESGEFGPFPSRVAPEAELVSAAPRVSGSMTYEATTAERGIAVLEVSTRFVWVYAFRGEASGDVEGFAVVCDELVWQQAESFVESSRGLWLYTAESHSLGPGCDGIRDRLLRPERSVLDEVVLDPGS